MHLFTQKYNGPATKAAEAVDYHVLCVSPVNIYRQSWLENKNRLRETRNISNQVSGLDTRDRRKYLGGGIHQAN